MESRAHVQCFEDQGSSREACFDCAQDKLVSLGCPFSCFWGVRPISAALCPTIESECTGCAGCEKATANLLTCNFASVDLDYGCRVGCDFDNDPGTRTECTSQSIAHTQCFEQGSALKDACDGCVQDKLNSITGAVVHCGQFSELLCPAIKSECTDCQGCKGATEDLIGCNLVSANSGCPFYCGFAAR